MILDGHIHIAAGECRTRELMDRMGEAGIGGALVISLPPASFDTPAAAAPAAARLDNLMEWTAGHERLYPFFWIDPLEAAAMDQAARAVDRGVAGFKVISNRHDPGDERAMPVYERIAQAGRPILFHSGILWDGRPSSWHCRPVLFEALMDVPRLRFALAHIGWPWCDELIAVYGKIQDARRQRPDLHMEMFIDLTPGTPAIYRREVLTRLLTIGYDVQRNIFFGTDCLTGNYKVDVARTWLDRDRDIYRSLDIDGAVQEQIFAANVERFIKG
jgi:predicted TIM-barrel fold metal-dependent hydrolase